MYCPQCGVEYREGYTSCSDCQVLLVHERPRRTSAEASVEPGDPDRDPFCAFRQGTDSRTLAELCAVLDEAGIPQRTVRREDRLFNRMDQPKLLVRVPASLYEKAEEVVGAAFSERPLLFDTAGFIPEGLEKTVDFDEDEAAMELEDSPLYSNATRAGRAEVLGEWYPGTQRSKCGKAIPAKKVQCSRCR
jgi:predicted nucleic acid-binding Zn ribbon protein